MDLEGRGCSEFYSRNTSEELFIKTMMESTVGMPAPTMEMLGFKNLAQNFRTDSEELFKSWLTNGENDGCHTTSVAHRPRQASRRISIELGSVPNQNTMSAIQRKTSDKIGSAQTIPVAADSVDDPGSAKTGVEKGMQASNLFLAKAWFHSSQPMTRSRSSELRRRYAAMQQSQTLIGIEAINEASGNIVNFKQEISEANGFNNISSVYENNHQLNTFRSPSNSSSSTFNNPQVGCVDKITSVVNMLKGTLERKKIGNVVDKVDSSLGYYSAEEAIAHGLNQAQRIQVHENNQGVFQNAPILNVTETGVLQKIEESLMEGILSPMNPIPMRTISWEPSQSESSVAPPIVSVSNAFAEIYDDPTISAQAPTVCESSGNQREMGRSQDFRERAYEKSKGDQKKGGLIRYGSITSAGSADRGDPTKKRRVERSRKMAEAKERSSTPAVPSDMQSILKRCENLEKEVRSLKLNLAFMNRKDSEQTKQIEELQKQNQELADEKERLLEEIERIIADTGNM